jgi:endoglucanase
MVTILFLLLALSSAQQWSSESGMLKTNGKRFNLKGLSWFGFETSLNVFHGLWARDYNDMFKWIASQNFNAMRIPFNLDLVLTDPMPTSISFGYCQTNISCNMDLKGLTSLQVLDKMIATAGAWGIQIMLDMHSFEPDAYMENGLWYDATHPESTVLKGWDILIARYKNTSNVFAVDLKNEPFSTTWHTGDNTTDWDAAIARIGNHILSQGVPWLIFFEGTNKSPPCAQACFWGENLQGQGPNPVSLSVANRLVYSPHTYGPDVAYQDYFQDPTFPANMPAIWTTHFAYLKAQGKGAIVTGEWGGHTTGADLTWLNAYISFMNSTDIRDQFFWCLNPDSGDTGGLLLDDWVTPVQDKLDMLAKLMPDPTKFV